MIRIELSGLRFHAFHGLYPEELKTGNEFEVNLSVSYVPVSGVITDLSDTIDYGSLYDLLKEEMQEPRRLLETLVMEIAQKIHLRYPLAASVEISVKKLSLPVFGFTGSAVVTYTKTFLQ